MENNALVIVGHSGSGKSTLVKALGELTGYETLHFGYIGNSLCEIPKDEIDNNEINEYILSCIISTLQKNKTIIIDGIVSEDVLKKLKGSKYSVRVFYLKTAYEERIRRITTRNLCSEKDAIRIEASKNAGKTTAGINEVIAMADVILDGTKTTTKLIQDIVLMSNVDKF